MDNINKIQEAMRIVENKSKLISAVCSACELNGELYVCAGKHGTLVCKKCLSKEKRNNVQDFCTKGFRQLINQEEDVTCSFIPLIPSRGVGYD